VVDQIPEPQGGTPMAQAIEHAHKAHKVHLIVISDGVPDSMTHTLDKAKAFMANGGKRIDAIYIGDDDGLAGGGAKFMADLAAIGGGSHSVTDLVEQKQLAQTIKGLLGDGGGSNGPIQL
jgi:hypothetical protein